MTMSEWTYAAILTALLGLAVGSFLNVCVYRIPAGKSVVSPPSHCPYCGTRLRPADLIPVASYLILKGRCRYCKTPVSLRYPLVEALTSALFLLVFYSFGAEIDLIKYLFLTALMIAVAFIDLDHYIIPNRLVLAGLIAGSLFIPLTGEPPLLDALSGVLAASGFLLFLYLVSRGGMGMGDIKLAAVIGIFLGWPMSLFAVFSACFLAGILGIALIATGVKKRKDPIPFGPFLAAGTFITSIWGPELAELYRSFILGF
ncbi:MAG: prepilin peptidase [Bacillota bacterium]